MRTIYLLCQPDGELYIEDKFSIHFDKAKAEEACAMMYESDQAFNDACKAAGKEEEMETGEWKVVTFEAPEEVKQSDDDLFSGPDGGLRARTLAALARDMEAAKRFGV